MTGVLYILCYPMTSLLEVVLSIYLSACYIHIIIIHGIFSFPALWWRWNERCYSYVILSHRFFFIFVPTLYFSKRYYFHVMLSLDTVWCSLLASMIDHNSAIAGVSYGCVRSRISSKLSWVNNEIPERERKKSKSLHHIKGEQWESVQGKGLELPTHCS